MLVTVFGDVRLPGFHVEAWGKLGNLFTIQQHLAGFALAQAGQRFDQLGLAIALHAGNAEDLAGVHLETNITDDLDTALVHDVQVFHFITTSPGLAGALSTVRITSRPTIMAASLCSSDLGGGGGAHHLTPAHDGDAVSHCQHFFELVGDKDDGNPALGELAHDAEQALRLPGG